MPASVAVASESQSYSTLRLGAEWIHFVDAAELSETQTEGEVGDQLAAPSRAVAPVTATVGEVGAEVGIGLEWFEKGFGDRSCQTP